MQVNYATEEGIEIYLPHYAIIEDIVCACAGRVFYMRGNIALLPAWLERIHLYYYGYHME
jgi:hypothetical protein